MPVLADDDVVVDGNAEWGGDLDDRVVIWISACDGVGSPEGWLCINPLRDLSFQRLCAVAPGQ